jgi:hypothetical protein
LATAYDIKWAQESLPKTDFLWYQKSQFNQIIDLKVMTSNKQTSLPLYSLHISHKSVNITKANNVKVNILIFSQWSQIIKHIFVIISIREFIQEILQMICMDSFSFNYLLLQDAPETCKLSIIFWVMKNKDKSTGFSETRQRHTFWYHVHMDRVREKVPDSISCKVSRVVDSSGVISQSEQSLHSPPKQRGPAID